jgi:uncharacterized OB-fold protein
MQIAQTWRLKGQRYAMKGNKCETCGQAQFPPRPVCPHCASKTASAYEYEHNSAVVESTPTVVRQAAR